MRFRSILNRSINSPALVLISSVRFPIRRAPDAAGHGATNGPEQTCAPSGDIEIVHVALLVAVTTSKFR